MRSANKKEWGNLRKKEQGFTILEVAVSLFIISMGVLGAMALVDQTIRVKEVNKNKVIAGQLAQEGVEIVRSIRDNNWLDEDDWHDGIINGGAYTVHYNGGVVDTDVSGLSASTTKLYLDPDGYYRHYDSPGSATSTIFRRIIKVDSSFDPSTSASTSVESVVQWQERGTKHEYTAETVLYNWRRPSD